MLKRLLEGFPFGAIVVSKTMTVSAANGHAARLLAIEPADLAPGTPARTVLQKLVARGDYGDNETAVNHVLGQLANENTTFTQKTASGMVLSVSFRAIDGERLVTIEDATEAHAEREALARNAEQMRDVLDVSPVAVAIVGPGGRLLYTNKRHDELYGVTADQMPKNVRELYVDPSQRDRFQEIFQREGRLINAELHNRRPCSRGTISNTTASPAASRGSTTSRIARRPKPRSKRRGRPPSRRTRPSQTFSPT
jgi:PAS domain S-box-containing protein